jgi:hypothetical protein
MIDCEPEEDEEDSRSLPHSHSPHTTASHGHPNSHTYDSLLMDNEDDEDDLDDLDELENEDDEEDDDRSGSFNQLKDKSASQRGRSKAKSSNSKNAKEGSKTSRLSQDSTSQSPTRSSQSRSISPSDDHTSYHDSPAAFPNLAAVAAANGIDSTTAMLAAQSLLQSNTTGLTFPSLAAAGLSLPNTPNQGDLTKTNLNFFTDAGSGVFLNTSTTTATAGNQPPIESASLSMDSLVNANNSIESLIASTRKRRNEKESMSERIKKIKPVPDDKKDDAYWERRRKNNEAAKRSRDLRRQKEDEIAVRASFLEQENLKLKAQVTILKAELSKLHFMLYNR